MRKWCTNCRDWKSAFHKTADPDTGFDINETNFCPDCGTELEAPAQP
jgi:hypothetical protein